MVACDVKYLLYVHLKPKDHLCTDKANWSSETLNDLSKLTKLSGPRAGHSERIH